jgi:hypothetical protein
MIVVVVVEELDPPLIEPPLMEEEPPLMEEEPPLIEIEPPSILPPPATKSSAFSVHEELSPSTELLLLLEPELSVVMVVVVVSIFFVTVTLGERSICKLN